MSRLLQPHHRKWHKTFYCYYLTSNYPWTCHPCQPNLENGRIIRLSSDFSPFTFSEIGEGMNLKKYSNVFRFLLWTIFFITFVSEFVKIVFELNPDYGHRPLQMANAFFWSSLFLIEILMAGIVVYFLVKYPARRMRLLILSGCHFSVILLLPVVLNNWSWTCLLYPWPHSLQAFDPATPRVAFYLSVSHRIYFSTSYNLQVGCKRILWILVSPRGILFRDLWKGI